MSGGLLAKTLSLGGIKVFLCRVLRALILAIQLDSDAASTWSNVTSSWILKPTDRELFSQDEKCFPKPRGEMSTSARKTCLISSSQHFLTLKEGKKNTLTKEKKLVLPTAKKNQNEHWSKLIATDQILNKMGLGNNSF